MREHFTKTLVYTAEELFDLDKKAFDTAKSTYIQGLQDEFFEDWNLGALAKDNFQNELANLGFYEIDVYLSGFCSQGDGASFEAKIGPEDALKLWPELAKYGDDLDTIKITQSGPYYHEYTMSFDGGLCWNSEHEWDLDLEKSILEFCRDLARDFYRQTEAEFWNLDNLTDSEFMGICQDLEYEFTELGERF